MTDQLAFGTTEVGRATLSCFHEPVPFDVANAKRGRDGWYAGVKCPSCRRLRAVLNVSYPTKELRNG